MELQEAAIPSVGAGGGVGEARVNTCEQAGATCLGRLGGWERRDEEGREVLRESQEETGWAGRPWAPCLLL